MVMQTPPMETIKRDRFLHGIPARTTTVLLKRMWQKSYCESFQVGPVGQETDLCPPSWENLQALTWFFPFSISRFVTFPKGSPSPITSASFMSLGSLRTWTTRDGTPEVRTSPLNFFVSLPLAAGRGWGVGTNKQADTIREGQNRRLWLVLNNGLIVMATQTNWTGQAFP